MSPLDELHMEKALVMVSPRYEEEMNEEIGMLTAIVEKVGKPMKNYDS